MWTGSRGAAGRSARPVKVRAYANKKLQDQLHDDVDDLEEVDAEIPQSDRHWRTHRSQPPSGGGRWMVTACVLGTLLIIVLALNGVMISRHMEVVSEVQRLAHSLVEAQHELANCKRHSKGGADELALCNTERTKLRSEVDSLQGSSSKQLKSKGDELNQCRDQVNKCQQEQQKLVEQAKSKAGEVTQCQQQQQQVSDQVKAKEGELAQCQQQQKDLQTKMQGLKNLFN